MILETMLENAGLEKGVNFISQVTRREDGTALRDEQGNLQRPDVIVLLPDSRKFMRRRDGAGQTHLRQTQP